MDPKAQSATDREYEDIEPFFEWHRDEGRETLVVMLPGFRRDELKVQVTSAFVLKISAQRHISGSKWRRVYKELSVPSDCDTNNITAKFEAGTLKINFPKLITPTAKSPEREGVDEKEAGKLEDQETSKADGEVSEKTQKVKEPAGDDLTKEKGKTSNGVNGKTGVQEEQEKAKRNGDGVSGKTPPAKQKEKEPAGDDFGKEKGKAAATKEDHDGKQRTKNVTRLKTRLLDFTLSLRSPADQEDYGEARTVLVEGLKKRKKLMKVILVALLVLVLGLYAKNAFKSPLGGSQEQEL